MLKEKLYAENGQWTEAGKKLSGKLYNDLDALIENYVGQFNRIEFEHFIQDQLSSCMATYFIKNHAWPTQE